METEILLNKNQVIESFGNLPDQVTADQLIERIMFVRLINERLREAQSEPGISHADFMRDFDEFKAQKRTVKRNSLS